MNDSMELPPGLEFLRTPLMSTTGAPSFADTSDSTQIGCFLNSPIVRPQGAGSEQACSREAPEACRGFAQQVREAVAFDVDVKIAERLESVMAQGDIAAKEFLGQSRMVNTELAMRVSQFKEREKALELENAYLQQTLNSVLMKLAQWGTGEPQWMSPMSCHEFLKAPSAAERCADGSSTTASERGGAGGGGSVATPSPHLTFDAAPFSIGGPRAPASESGSSSDSGRVSVEPPPGLERRTPKLPDAPPQVPSTPLSLADALGLDSAGSGPQSVASSSPQSVTPPLVVPSLSAAAAVFTPFSAEYCSEAFSAMPLNYAAEVETEPADGFVFNITLRKAEGCSFGLATSTIGYDGVLHVDGVLPGGAAEAWNRQCASSGAAEKVLLPGDAIVSVNSVTCGPEEMKLECETQQLLRLLVVRSDGPRSAPPPHVADVSERSGTLRAEASEFVPMGASNSANEYSDLHLPVC